MKEFLDIIRDDLGRKNASRHSKGGNLSQFLERIDVFLVAVDAAIQGRQLSEKQQDLLEPKALKEFWSKLRELYDAPLYDSGHVGEIYLQRFTEATTDPILSISEEDRFAMAVVSAIDEVILPACEKPRRR